jgi:hypothetical protein
MYISFTEKTEHNQDTYQTRLVQMGVGTPLDLIGAIVPIYADYTETRRIMGYQK